MTLSQDALDSARNAYDSAWLSTHGSHAKSIAAAIEAWLATTALPDAPTPPRAPAAETEGLIAFARDIIRRGVFEAYDMDGEDIQAAALEHGLLVETTFDPKKHHAGDVDIDPGEPWYVMSPALLASPVAVAPAAETAEREAERRYPRDTAFIYEWVNRRESAAFLAGASWQREQSALSESERKECADALEGIAHFAWEEIPDINGEPSGFLKHPPHEDDAAPSPAPEQRVETLEEAKPLWRIDPNRIKLEAVGDDDSPAEIVERNCRMLETWAPECFPAGPDGKVHLARAFMESAAKELRQLIPALSALPHPAPDSVSVSREWLERLRGYIVNGPMFQSDETELRAEIDALLSPPAKE